MSGRCKICGARVDQLCRGTLTGRKYPSWFRHGMIVPSSWVRDRDEFNKAALEAQQQSQFDRAERKYERAVEEDQRQLRDRAEFARQRKGLRQNPLPINESGVDLYTFGHQEFGRLSISDLRMGRLNRDVFRRRDGKGRDK